jgi:L-Ala-D/L-Glu epimerase / N-acetyl-D-glutamate racemase
VPVIAHEAVLDAHDAMQAVRLRACDLINIKLMKCGGLLAALALDAVAETAGIGCQIGTMVESSVASAAGLPLALVLHNAATAEMGGPFKLAEDVGGLRNHYEHARVTVPAGHGLGVEPEEAVLKRYAGEREWITV